MLKVKNIEVYNFEQALRGMRHPLESYDTSDSKFGKHALNEQYIKDLDAVAESYRYWQVKFNNFSTPNYAILDALEDNNKLYDTNEQCHDYVFIGSCDLALAQRLISGGSEHRKFMRQILVSMEITAPLYWWKEFDTYKVGTTANSTSTMHTLHKSEMNFNNFSFDTICPEGEDKQMWVCDLVTIMVICEKYRKLYMETGDKAYWRRLIQILPEGFNQTRTVTLNYENLLNIVKQRKGHKLTEWHQLIDVIKTLPYANDLIFFEKGENNDYGFIQQTREYNAERATDE